MRVVWRQRLKAFALRHAQNASAILQFGSRLYPGRLGLDPGGDRGGSGLIARCRQLLHERYFQDATDWLSLTLATVRACKGIRTNADQRGISVPLPPIMELTLIIYLVPILLGSASRP